MPRFPESQIEKFFTRILFTGDAGTIVLASLVGAGNERHITDWDLPDNGKDFDFKQQLEDILTYAQDDCNGYGVPSKYVIIAYAEDADIARSPTFELKPEVEDDEVEDAEFEDSDPPEVSRMLAKVPAKGLSQDMALSRIVEVQASVIGQMMRHTENKERLHNQSMHQVMAVQRDTISRLSSQNENLLASHTSLIDAKEKLKSKEHERAIELRKIQRTEERTEQVLSKVMMLAPVAMSAIAQKFLGGKAQMGPQSPDVIMLLDAMKELILSIDDTQMPMLAQILRPEQVVAFQKAIETFAVVEETKENNGVSPAQDDASGNNPN